MDTNTMNFGWSQTMPKKPTMGLGPLPADNDPGMVPAARPPAMKIPMGGLPGGMQAPAPMGSASPMSPRGLMPLPALGSRIPSAMGNRNGGDDTRGYPMTGNYAHTPYGGASADFGLDSLANRSAVPKGRSMREAPERRLETAARYGSLRAAEALVGLKQTGMQRDFQVEQNQMYRDQQEKMFGLEQGAVDARHQQDRTDRKENWTLEEQARQKREDERRNWELTLHGLGVGEDAMKAERERQQQEAERKRTPNIGTIPLPGNPNYNMAYADGRVQATLPVPDATAKPKPEEIAKHIQDMQKNGVQAQYGKGGWTYAPHAAKPTTLKAHKDGKVMDFPAGYELPPGWEELKKKGEAPPAVPPATPAGQGGWKSLIPKGY